MKRITKQSKQHTNKPAPQTKDIRVVETNDLTTVVGGVMKKLNEMDM